MQHTVLGREMFDRHQMRAMHGAQQPDAGIDALVGQAVIGQAPDEDGTGAAVAFGAAFLGPGQPPPQAQIIEQGFRRAEIP